MSDAFWLRVQKGSEFECWPWLGTITHWGYGEFWITDTMTRRMAHRVSYELMREPIPEGLVIDHLCRNHACVNPSHLEAVTNQVNTRRGIGPSAINARRTHCVNGHEFNAENTYIRPKGQRHCRVCDRLRKRNRPPLSRRGEWEREKARRAERLAGEVAAE